MEWQHYNRVKASMAYIERLIQETEEDISGKSRIYRYIKNDMNQAQIKKVKNEINQIKKLLKKVKKEFVLEPMQFPLSRIINATSSFIWETIEDLWSNKIEKSSGKINSQQEKEKLDAILKQLYEHNAQLGNIVKK